MKNENKKIYVMLGYQTDQYDQYKKIQNKLNSIYHSKQKIKYLEENNIDYYFSEEYKNIENLKTSFYYVIEFESLGLV